MKIENEGEKNLKIDQKSINDVDSEGRTALHYACMRRDIDAIRYLVQQGASFEIKDKSGALPQNYALIDYELAKNLLTESADSDLSSLNEANFEKLLDFEEFGQKNLFSEMEYDAWIKGLYKFLEASPKYQRQKALALYKELEGPHFTLAAPNFLDENFTLTEDSKKLFELGNPGQGYVGIINLEDKTIHLLPSFNSGDGLERVDKNHQPFKYIVESRGMLGGLGDLHSKACSILNLVAESGPGKKIMGFGIWKSGAGVKFVSSLPSRAGRVPQEYLLVKSAKGYELYYVTEERSLMNVGLNFFSEHNKHLLGTDIALDQIEPDDRASLEREIRAYDQLYRRHYEGNIKFAKNRSTSQNSYTVKYSDAYSLWFNARVIGHSSHAEDLKRELPLAVFQNVMTNLCSNLHVLPINVLHDNEVPGGIDGMRAHLQLENFWKTHKNQAIMEYAFYSNNKELIKIAIERGAKFSDSLAELSRYAFTHRSKELRDLLIEFATPDELEKVELVDLILHFRGVDPSYVDYAMEFLDKLAPLIASKKILFETALDGKDSFLGLAMVKAGYIPENDKIKTALENDMYEVVSQRLLGEKLPTDFITILIKDLMKKEVPHLPTLQHLLEHLKDHYPDNSKAKFLMLAIKNDWPVAAIKLLTNYGADPAEINSDAISAFDLAIKQKKYHLLSLLLDGNHRSSSLLYAVKNLISDGKYDLVLPLLAKNEQIIPSIDIDLKYDLIINLKDRKYAGLLAKLAPQPKELRQKPSEKTEEKAELKEPKVISKEELYKYRAEIELKLKPLAIHIRKIFEENRSEFSNLSLEEFERQLLTKKSKDLPSNPSTVQLKLKALIIIYNAIKIAALDMDTDAILKQEKINAILDVALTNHQLKKERDLLTKVAFAALNTISIIFLGIPLLINYASSKNLFFSHQTKSEKILENDIQKSFKREL